MKYLLLVVSIFGLDEGIKQRIDKKEPLGKERRVPKLPVVIEKYYNNGAALNLLAKKPKIMLGLHSACMAGLMTIYGFVLRKGNTGLKTGMSMMVGGGLSNLWDRIHKKHVVDYTALIHRGNAFQELYLIFPISLFLSEQQFLCCLHTGKKTGLQPTVIIPKEAIPFFLIKFVRYILINIKNHY